jgi:hypothetical protein
MPEDYFSLAVAITRAHAARVLPIPTIHQGGITMFYPGFKCLTENHENGRYWYNEQDDISVFEDLQHGMDHRRFYAWDGDWDAHDAAEHSPVFDTFDAAVDWINENEGLGQGI